MPRKVSSAAGTHLVALICSVVLYLALHAGLQYAPGIRINLWRAGAVYVNSFQGDLLDTLREGYLCSSVLTGCCFDFQSRL